MPISSFDTWLQKLLAFLPGTYGTSLLRNHAMRGAIEELAELGIPQEAIDGLRDAVDCNVYFFNEAVAVPYMYLPLVGVGAALVIVYIFLNKFCRKKIK